MGFSTAVAPASMTSLGTHADASTGASTAASTGAVSLGSVPARKYSSMELTGACKGSAGARPGSSPVAGSMRTATTPSGRANSIAGGLRART